MNSRRIAALALAACVLPAPLAAQDLASFERRVTEHRLDNGLTFLIYERPGAPVASFFTYVDAGSAQEVAGITGLAHMFEHMAFKGTSKIGTRDIAAERAALARVDATYDAYDAERRRHTGSDPERLAELEAAWKEAREAAAEYSIKDEFSQIVDRAGGVNLNATTGADRTAYVMSLPANKVELWAYLESERYLDPVLREFYTERDVVMEERRLRTESQPIGRLIEQILAAAFVAHPYGYPGVGYMSDLQSFSREDAIEFFRTYYSPSNMIIAIVGGVKAAEVVPLIDRYFGRLPRGPEAPTLRTAEPEPVAEKIVRMPDPSQPVYLEGYMRPSVLDPDDTVYDAIADVLSTGRTSRLYRSLVRDKKVASSTGAFSGFPGIKYPNLMLLYAFPTPGHSNEEVQAAIRVELERIAAEPISDEELKMVKTRARAGLIRSLDDNFGLANQLATYQGLFGDWRELFRNVERIESVTKDDIMRVAARTFVPTNRTVGMIETEEQEAAE